MDEHESSARGIGAVAGAAGLVVAIVAALVVFQVTRPEDRAQTATAEASELADAKMIYRGSRSFAMTSWLDLAGRELVKSSSSGDFDMTIRLTGIPDTPGFPAELSFDGTFTQELERV